MTLKELVLEMIANAYENGYETEIEAMMDDELADELSCYMVVEDYTYEEILAAVKEIRGVH